MHQHVDERPAATVGRRRFLAGAAGGLASAGLVGSVAHPAEAEASARGRRPHGRPLPPPKPIPGGVQPPGAPLLHVFLPGPQGQTLPFTGLTLQGLNVEPSTITDFKGVTAQGYLAGSATGSDGQTYNLEADIRAFEGRYVAEDGSARRGAFAFV